MNGEHACAGPGCSVCADSMAGEELTRLRADVARLTRARVDLLDIAERAVRQRDAAEEAIAGLREAARNLLAEREQAEDARALHDAIRTFCERAGVRP